MQKGTVLREQPQVDAAIEIAGWLNNIARLYQIPNWEQINAILLTEWIIDTYPTEQMETIQAALTRPFSSGKTWRLTPDTIAEWMQVEIDKDAKTREKLIHNYKQSETENEWSEERLKEWETLIQKSEGFKPSPKLSEKEVKEEGQEKPKKPAYTPPNREYVISRYLHIEYCRANYDANTGHKKECWMSEEEWLKLDF